MITARISGLRQALAQLEKIKNKQQAEIKRAFTVSALNVEREAKRNAPVNMGRLRSDIQRSTDFDDGMVVRAEVFNTVDYAPFIEFGTKSNVNVPAELTQYALQFKASKTGSFDELLQNIAEWANRKGIDPEAVFPIARKIAREGIEARPYLFPAWERERPKLLNELRKAL
jgi:HK97 gp10 family phage protein